MNHSGRYRRFSLALFLIVAIFALTSCGLGVPWSRNSEFEENMSKLESEKAELEKQNQSLRLEAGAAIASEPDPAPETAGQSQELPESGDEAVYEPYLEEPVTETLSQEEKEHLPPRKVYMEYNGQQIEVSMPTFKNLAEQESFVRYINNQLLTVSATYVPGADETEEEGPSFDGEVLPPERTKPREVASDPNYKAADWAFFVAHDGKEGEHKIDILSQDKSERLRRLFTEYVENNAVKTAAPESLNAFIAFTDGFELGFSTEDFYSGNSLRLLSREGEVYELSSDNEFAAALLQVYEREANFLLLRDVASGREKDKVKAPHSLLCSFEGIPEADSLKLVLENPGEESWNYFDDYFLYRYNGKAFEPVPLKEGAVMEWKAKVLGPGERVVIDHPLAEQFGELPRGLYSIQRNIVNAVMKTGLSGVEYYTTYFILP